MRDRQEVGESLDLSGPSRNPFRNSLKRALRPLNGDWQGGTGMHARRLLTAGLTVATAVGLALPPVGASAGTRESFRAADLVSHIPGRGQHLHLRLVNPPGISASATRPMWVSHKV